MGQHKLKIGRNSKRRRVPASAFDCQAICDALCEQPPSDASVVGVHIGDRLHQAGDAGNQGCLCRMEIGVGTLHPSPQCRLIVCHDGVEVAIKAYQQGSQFPPLSRTDDPYLILKFKRFSEKTPDLLITPRILLGMNVDAPSARHSPKSLGIPWLNAAASPPEAMPALAHQRRLYPYQYRDFDDNSNDFGLVVMRGFYPFI